jgi:hypothetical protein
VKTATRSRFFRRWRGLLGQNPADLLERLTNALARWDGRGPTRDDDLEAGKEMASAVMALMVWNGKQ